MEVKVRRLTSWNEVVNAARFTANLNDIGKEPSNTFKDGLLLAEHSPIRLLIYEISLYGIPSWCSQHLSRHDAFSMHNVREGAGDTHFVATQRTDRTGIERNKQPQDAPVDHRIVLNAQDLINISRKRLCNCASKETREIWEEVRRKVSEIDPEVAAHMVRECVYRGFCPEPRTLCRYAETEPFKQERDNYVSQKIRQDEEKH